MNMLKVCTVYNNEQYYNNSNITFTIIYNSVVCIRTFSLQMSNIPYHSHVASHSSTQMDRSPHRTNGRILTSGRQKVIWRLLLPLFTIAFVSSVCVHKPNRKTPQILKKHNIFYPCKSCLILNCT